MKPDMVLHIPVLWIMRKTARWRLEQMHPKREYILFN